MILFWLITASVIATRPTYFTFYAFRFYSQLKSTFNDWITNLFLIIIRAVLYNIKTQSAKFEKSLLPVTTKMLRKFHSMFRESFVQHYPFKISFGKQTNKTKIRDAWQHSADDWEWNFVTTPFSPPQTKKIASCYCVRRQSLRRRSSPT